MKTICKNMKTLYICGLWATRRAGKRGRMKEQKQIVGKDSLLPSWRLLIMKLGRYLRLMFRIYFSISIEWAANNIQWQARGQLVS